MNAEDWEIVRDTLETYVNWPISLRIEGKTISLRTQRIKNNTLGIVVFVDGWFKGEWITNDVPERRFFQPVVLHLYSRKHRTPAYRKLAKKLKIDVDAKSTHYRPWFSSFKALKRHYTATFQEIELVKEAA